MYKEFRIVLKNYVFVRLNSEMNSEKKTRTQIFLSGRRLYILQILYATDY